MAKAQDAAMRHALISLRHFNELKFATINIRGANELYKKVEAEQWMKRNKINVLIVTEATIYDTQISNRTDYT